MSWQQIENKILILRMFNFPMMSNRAKIALHNWAIHIARDMLYKCEKLTLFIKSHMLIKEKLCKDNFS